MPLEFLMGILQRRRQDGSQAQWGNAFDYWSGVLGIFIALSL